MSVTGRQPKNIEPPRTPRQRLLDWYDRVDARLKTLPAEELEALNVQVRAAYADVYGTAAN